MCRSVLFEIYHIALAFVHLSVHLCICESMQLNLPLKGSNPHWVQGTPFALTLQTSPIGLLMKTSQQPTSNVLLNHYQCSFGQRLNWFLFQPSEQAENSEGFEPAGYPSRGSPLRAQAWPACPGTCILIGIVWTLIIIVEQVRIHLLIKMAELEARLMAGATEKIQLGAFLAIFQVGIQVFKYSDHQVLNFLTIWRQIKVTREMIKAEAEAQWRLELVILCVIEEIGGWNKHHQYLLEI